MKINHSRLFSGVITLSMLFSLGGLVHSADAQAPAPGKTAMSEKHPDLMKAKRRLEASIDALQHAQHDFDGHREKALDLEQKAMAEINLALQSDKH